MISFQQFIQHPQREYIFKQFILLSTCQSADFFTSNLISTLHHFLSDIPDDLKVEMFSGPWSHYYKIYVSSCEQHIRLEFRCSRHDLGSNCYGQNVDIDKLIKILNHIVYDISMDDIHMRLEAIGV